MSFLIINAYKALTYFFIGLFKSLRPFTKGKLRELLDDKNFDSGRGRWVFNQSEESLKVASRRIWIHAASGEIEYARPVIREIKAQDPTMKIIVTYSSPSAKKMLKSIEGIDAWGPIPWDRKAELKAFLKRFQPQALLVARTDLWPMQAVVCKENQIPSFLFSATFAQNSSRLKGLTKHLTAYALNQLTGIYVVNQDDQKNLAQLDLDIPIKVSGDTRYDQVFHRLNNSKPLKNQLQPIAPVFVLGSTWPEDEAVLLPMLPKLIQESWQVIIAPHETTEHHLQDLKKHLQRLHVPFDIYSTSNKRESPVLIIDQVGILADLYKWGDLAFVGGSFKKQVHSVMEPLAAGLPVLVGPFHLNNRESLIMQNIRLNSDICAVTAAPEANLHHVVNKWAPVFEAVQNEESRLNIKTSLQNHMKQQTGNSSALVRELLKNLS